MRSFADATRLRNGLLASPGQPPVPAPPSAAAPAAADTSAQGGVVEAGALRGRLEEALTDMVCDLLKIGRGDVDRDVEFGDFGFDSISLTGFGNALNARYGLDLSPTAFFEHPTIEALAQHLLADHQGRLAPHFEVRPSADRSSAPPVTESTQAEAAGGRRRRARWSVATEPARGPSRAEPVAIIGMSGCFPEAPDLQALWENLRAGRDCVGTIPTARWGEDRRIDIRRAGVIEIDRFDPLFFGISPREAEGMDPQQRLLMTYVWKVIEDAGYSPQSLSGSQTAIFVGTCSSGYASLLAQAGGAVEGNNSTSMVPSIGPNRMSYLLNLHGPSEPIETACSSSLVAVHRALNCLREGQCEMAIVGGVNTLVSPEVHISYAKAGMLSPDGLCRTFSADANGYVRGEGAGMLMLKTLSAAQRDGDHVWAVIRSSAQNHGGRANSLTAPNPRAQAELIKTAIRQSGVDPRTISYIEAHGTGTPLGDPIEIQGLKTAFAELAEAEGGEPGRSYCGLGSVKTNIGHLEMAAGVAGVIKVILQMRHGTLVKSLHSETLNPHIRLENSPFYVVRETSPWTRPKDAAGHDLPLRAGVSSFGFGGVNAHVILEEAPSPPPEVWSGPVVVVLSARTPEGLKEQVRQLDEALEDLTEAELGRVAWTLQTGREAMEHRLAVVAQSLGELRAKLAAYAAGERADELYQGEVRRNREALAVFSADEDLQQAVAAWMAKGKLSKLAELWVRGLPVTWRDLYGGSVPRRLSLPTYPFARERYWVEPADGPAQGAPAGAGRLHPLLHANTSDLSEQRFSSWFTGEEPVLRDHVVVDRRILPGVAHLEMARAAVRAASGRQEAAAGLRLEQVVFARPVVVGPEGLELHIGLEARADGTIGYEIYSETQGEAVVHSQGRAVLGDVGPVLGVDLAQLRAQCGASLEGAACYEVFDGAGLHYGPQFRSLVRLWSGRAADGSRLALGELQLPGSALEGYDLHPGLMDGALQTSLGLMDDSAPGAGPGLPFALERVDLLRPLGGKAWALARYSAGSGPQSPAPKLDIDILDEAGEVCVRLQGFASRKLAAPAHSPLTDQVHIQDDTQTLLMRPLWTAQTAEPGAQLEGPRWVVLCEMGPQAEAAVRAQSPDVRCVALGSSALEVAGRYTDYAVQLLGVAREILETRTSQEVLVQLAIPAAGEGALHRGLGGLLRSAARENPRLRVQVLACEADLDGELLADRLQVEAGTKAQDLLYRQGQRHVLKLEEVGCTPVGLGGLYRAGGTYLITGGAGGLGLIFAEAIARQARGVSLILTGRSAADAALESRLAGLRSLGAQVVYHAVDVCDGPALRRLVEELIGSGGALNGVIHSAGVLRDSFVVNKSEEDLRTVFGPKVSGLVNLDEATRDVALDSFVVFGSISGVNGGVGQADYAAANGFMDAYAAYRNELVSQGLREGRTLSVDWPFWAEGGMQIDGPARDRMWRSAGLSPLETAAGIAALGQALVTDASQVVVVSGDATRLRNGLLASPGQPPVPAPPSAAAPAAADTSAQGGVVEAGALRGRLEEALTDMVCDLLKIGRGDVDRDVEFGDFGFDSISLTGFGNALNARYGLDLSPTAFFEHPTIEALAQHLLADHQGRLAPHFEVRPSADRSSAPPVTESTQAEAAGGRRRRARWSVATEPARGPSRAEPVAIIGMSGCFPEAPDLQALWENLRAGRDCVGTIPTARWGEDRRIDIRRAGVIEIDRFDPLFFGISPREAEGMDPQQRLLMTYVWKVIEDAGYSPQSLSGSQTAIFVGTCSSGYASLLAQAGGAVEGNNSTSMVPSIGPNRMSYLLNLHGPSEPIETACSSSLVAVHRALNCLREGQCEMAIVGGVNTLVSPEVHISYAKAGMLSPDGLCRTFSADANGYVRGEGAGMLMLKTLSAAQRDGDHVWAVIRSSAQNHGGRANSLTAPNPRAQAELIKTAIRQSGVDPRTISYIEAHGTGTPLGDPIEIQGLKTAFAELAEAEGGEPGRSYCGLGSVKTNIGHLEMAAGVAGVIKVILQMRHGTLVKSLHSETLNPHIRLENSPFYVVRETSPWTRPKDAAGHDLPLRAGVSSFGFGGVNAHVILEEAPSPPPEVWSGPVVVVLSARTPEGLKEQVRQLDEALEDLTEAELGRVAWTLQTGREAMEHRLAVVAQSLGELRAKLAAYAAGERADELYQGEVRRNREALAVFSADEDLQQAVAAWMAKGKLSKLAELWVRGLPVTWRDLYGGSVPRRLSLPTYPFARERYWVEPAAGPAQGAPAGAGRLHPLLHANTSDLKPDAPSAPAQLHPLLHVEAPLSLSDR